MVRKLALAVSIALGTLSVPAHALGLGELQSKSLLNQNFNGNITLLSVNPEEIDGIRVKLADTEAFSRAGVERPFYLSLLKFQPLIDGAGKPVIQVSTDFPIREPFLNFLVEVNWPNGRLLREYTVLLDPPTTTTRRPPRPAPATMESRPTVAPPVTRAPAPATPAHTAASPSSPVVAAAPGEYGPVQANETAWSIAKKVRPSVVSMEQMMMALLAANPQAFIDNNINRLRRGRILRVPALDEIQQLTRQQARQAYREQQDQWLARRDARLQAAAAEEAPVATDQAAPGDDDRLRIATARPEGEGEAGASEDDATQETTSDLQSRLIVARENAETSRQQAETLRSQVDDLQARLADMQRLLSLKDEQLARLQDQVATGEIEAPATATVDEPEAPVTEAAVEPATPITEVAVEPPSEQVAETTAETAPADALDEVLADLESAAAESAAKVPPAVASDTPVPSFVPPEGYQIPDVTPLVDVDAIVEGRVPTAPVVAPEAEIVASQPTAPVAVFVPPEGYQIPDVTPLVDVDAIVEGRVSATGPDETLPTAPPVVSLPDISPVEPEIAIETEDEPATEPAPAVAEEPVQPAMPAEPEVARPQILPPALATLVEENIVPIAGGGVALLGLIGWLATRRRKQEPAPAPVASTAPAVADRAEAPSADQPAVASETLSDLPDSAFLDEFSPNDINSLQDETGEVDPVSEADVYIAYGRYQQAQELLRQALERDPDRLALKHKLLEVHYATRDGDAFAVLSQEMVDAGQDVADETAWARAQDMGRELQPNNRLFALPEEVRSVAAAAGIAATATAAVSTTADSKVSAAAVDSDTLSIADLDLSDLDEEYDIHKAEESAVDAPSEVSISLDLDEPMDTVDEPSGDLEVPDIPESLSLDDVSSLNLAELDEPATAEKASSAEADTLSDSFDLDSMMAEAEAAIDAEDTTLNLDSDFSADELQAELDQLSDLSVLASTMEKTEDKAAAATDEAPANLGLVEEDQAPGELGLDQPLDLYEAMASTEEETIDSELMKLDPDDSVESEDDITTKLDLAKAYVEMGDEDGARSILEEVVSEGNAGQKDEAEQLLSELA